MLLVSESKYTTIILVLCKDIAMKQRDREELSWSDCHDQLYEELC